MSRASDAFHSFLRFVKEEVQDIFTGFMSAATQALREEGPVLIQAAQDAVNAAETSPGDGKAKRQAAFDAIVKDLHDKGLPIIESDVNLAIEVALKNLKAAQGTGVAPVAPAAPPTTPPPEPVAASAEPQPAAQPAA